VDVLIVGETHSTPELRHEVPLAVLDPFVYAETGGRRVVAIAAMETPRIEELGIGLDLRSGFIHALGHGVGLEAHEAPGMGLIGQELVEGDVIAIEPGLYREGVGGVRIEDLVLVTASGGEVLTDFSYDFAVT
jgi:hypothetical protein